MSKFKLITSIIFIGLLAYGGFTFYKGWSTPARGETQTLTIAEGQGKGEVSKMLKDKNLINSDALFTLRLASNNVLIRPGEYKLEGGQTPEELSDQIAKISQEIYDKETKRVARKSVKVMVPEGKTADEIIEILKTSGLKNADKMANFWKTKQAGLDYAFLPSPLNCEYGDVDNCIKYYYEGYLYPNTYEIYEDASEKEITKTFLDGFNTNVYAKVGKGKSADELFKTVVIASIVEKETGRPGGVNSGNISELNNERQMVARVLFNRMEEGMKLQSDPTVSYGLGKKVCQQGRSITNCIYLDDPMVLNSKYNTYQIKDLPIGPITSPQFDSINASINPPDNDYLFFVADLSGKKYFAKTNAEHENNIAKATAANNAR